MARSPRKNLVSALRWHDYKNDTSEVIPAGAILRVSSATPNVSQGQSRPAFLVGKPDAVGSQYRHAVNALNRVPAGGYGQLTFEGPVFAKYETGDGTPALGEAWGPNNNEWVLRKRIGGFVVDQVSTNGTTAGVMVVRFAPWLYTYGKLDADIAHASSATASVWDSNGDTTFNVTVYDPGLIGTGKEIVSGSWVHAHWNTLDNHWILTGASACPSTA